VELKVIKERDKIIKDVLKEKVLN